MRRCSRCILPETVPGISFNSEGVCNFCLSYRKESYRSPKELAALIESAKRQGKKYECIVPLSGGRDSTYVLYVARKMFDLKVLAVSYDNEFRVEQALINMQKACDKLGVDFVSVRSRRDRVKSCVKYSILSAVEFGQYGVCNACEYGYKSVVYRMAEKYDVPIIFWGESQLEKTTDMDIRTTGEKHDLLKYFKLLNIYFYLYEFNMFLHRKEFPVPGNSAFVKANPILKNREIAEIRLFDYIPWDRAKIKETIIGKLGWEKPEGHASTWRTDCELHSFVNYCYFKLIGCTKDCFGYCKMINSGQLPREEALRQEEETVANINNHMEELLRDKIGLSPDDIRKIMSFST